MTFVTTFLKYTFYFQLQVKFNSFQIFLCCFNSCCPFQLECHVSRCGECGYFWIDEKKRNTTCPTLQGKSVFSFYLLILNILSYLLHLFCEECNTQNIKVPFERILLGILHKYPLLFYSNNRKKLLKQQKTNILYYFIQIIERNY